MKEGDLPGLLAVYRRSPSSRALEWQAASTVVVVTAPAAYCSSVGCVASCSAMYSIRCIQPVLLVHRADPALWMRRSLVALGPPSRPVETGGVIRCCRPTLQRLGSECP